MKEEHCFFKTSYGTVTMHPNRGAQCTVNGVECKEPVILKQGTAWRPRIIDQSEKIVL